MRFILEARFIVRLKGELNRCFVNTYVYSLIRDAAIEQKFDSGNFRRAIERLLMSGSNRRLIEIIFQYLILCIIGDCY